MAFYLMLSTSILLVYIYLGYPLCLALLARLFPQKHRYADEHIPSATLIISAYNEEDVIEAKIRNALELDYPGEKLTIMVVSDASTDRTDEIVTSFRDSGVILVRSNSHRGKTFALNQAFADINSEIVVFSDANALYERHAVKRLTRHFADAQIGYVVGHARYVENLQTAAGVSEGAYWNIETKIKEWESTFSSVVGGDGAIYAIRSELYEPLHETDINDFVNPLQIVAKGFRGIYEPEAWCTEKPAGHFIKEFSRKVRISNRSFNGLLRVPAASNPIKTGRFAWQLISHKLLRWFSPYILCLNFLAAIATSKSAPESALTLCLVAFYGFFSLFSLIGWWLDKSGSYRTIFSIPYYFSLMNSASAVGILLRLKGEIISTWETVRTDKQVRGRMPSLLPIFMACTMTAAILRVADGFGNPALLIQGTAYILTGVIFYMYLGYPLLLTILARLLPVQIQLDNSYTPKVTLLISAFNEECHIHGKLHTSLALDYPKELLNIVVVSDGSTDRTNKLVKEYEPLGIKLIAFNSNRGKIAALNDAMEQIESEIVVFSDANVIYDQKAVRKLVRNFNDPSVGAVSGRVFLDNDSISYGRSEKIYYCIEHYIQKMEGATGTLVGADGAMYAIRRGLFQRHPTDTILDDFVISMDIARQGYRVVHEPEALGHERNIHELKEEFDRKARIISGGFQCLFRGDIVPTLSQPLLLFNFVSHKLLRWFSGILLIPLFLLLCIIHLSEKLANLPLDILFHLMIASSLLALIGQLVPACRKIIPINMLHYVFMLALASLVGLYRELTGSQKVAWRGGVIKCAE